MQQTMQWNSSHIKQCEQRVGQGVLRDERSLVFYSEDFGRLVQREPAAVFVPTEVENLAKILHYANSKNLPVTIRGNGLSQGGQALTVDGGMIIHVENFRKVLEKKEHSIWVESNTSWSDLIAASLPNSQMPYVVPYNCNLSVGGVLSAGGIGSSSFRYGSTTAHVKALEVVTADGAVHQVDESSPLFHACLGGQGRFAVITKAEMALRSCQKQVRTFFLLYLDKDSWHRDMRLMQSKAAYLESFCTPTICGAKISEKGRCPFAEWFFVLHVSVEYEENAPELHELDPNLSPWKVVHQQDESISSYLHRHDSRFQVMKLTGQWALQHPWYECFVPEQVLFAKLDHLLSLLPVYYATVLQIVPIKKVAPAGFFTLPEAEHCYAIMILNPGLPSPLIPGCLETISKLDALFLPLGGKRYLSGYLGEKLPETYWQNHFGEKYENWIDLKKSYDPNKIFGSMLHGD